MRPHQWTSRGGGLPQCRAGPGKIKQTRYSFSTCEYSSSTGVERPKIDTATLRRARSSSTSSTRPLNEVKGPSATRTCSPISKVTDGFGRSDTREVLRRHFEVDPECTVYTTLHTLAGQGQFDKARLPQILQELGIDPEKVDPLKA